VKEGSDTHAMTPTRIPFPDRAGIEIVIIRPTLTYRGERQLVGPVDRERSKHEVVVHRRSGLACQPGLFGTHRIVSLNRAEYPHLWPKCGDTMVGDSVGYELILRLGLGLGLGLGKTDVSRQVCQVGVVRVPLRVGDSVRRIVYRGRQTLAQITLPVVACWRFPKLPSRETVRGKATNQQVDHFGAAHGEELRARRRRSYFYSCN